MSQNKFEFVYNIGAKLSSSFSSSFKNASKSIKDAASSVQNLNLKASKVDQLVKLRTEAKNLSKAYFDQKGKVDQLQKAVNACVKPVASLNKEFATETKKLTEAKAALDSHLASIRKITEEQKLQGKSLAELTKQRDKYSSVLKAQAKLEKTQASLSKASAKISGMQASVSSGAMSSAVFVSTMANQIKGTLSAPLEQAMALQDQMDSLKMVVDFGSDEELVKFKDSMLALSLEAPQTVEALMDVAKAGGEIGLKANELTGFVKQAERMTQAYGLSAQDAGNMLAQWRQGMNLTQKQAEELADVTLHLSGNNTKLAQNVGNVMASFGSQAKAMGLTEKELAAFSASLMQTGVKAEDVVPAIKNVMKTLSSGKGLSKLQAEAFTVMNIDPQQLANELQKDASGAITKVFSKLNSIVPAEKHMQYLEVLFGKSANAIKPLLAQTQNLEKNFKAAGDSAAYAGKLEDKYNSQLDKASDAFTIMGNAMTYVKALMGEALLEPAKEFANSMAKAVKPIGEWIKNNKELVATIVKVASYVAVAVIGIHILRATILYTASAFLSVVNVGIKAVSVFSSMSTWFPKLTAGLKAVGIAMKGMFLSPLGIAIAVIAGVVVAGYLLWKNWDTIKEKCSKLGEKISSVFASIKAWTTDLWKTFSEKFPNLSKIVSDTASAIWAPIQGIINTISGIIKFVKGVFTGDWGAAWEGVKDVGKGAWDTISGIATAPMKALGSVAQNGIKAVTDLFPDVSKTWSKTCDQVSGFVSSTWNGAWNSAKGFVSGAWASIKEKFSDVSGGAVSTFSEVAGQVGTTWNNAWNNAGTIVGGAWDSIKKTTGNLAVSVGKTFADLKPDFSSLKNGVKSGLNAITSLFVSDANAGELTPPTIAGGQKVEGPKPELTSFTDSLKRFSASVSETFNGLGSPIDTAKKAFGQFNTFLSTNFNVDLNAAWESAKKVIKPESFNQAIEGTKKTFSGLTAFVSGVFNGDWSKSWEGVKTSFSGVWDTLSGVAQGPMNAIKNVVDVGVKSVEGIFPSLPKAWENTCNNISAAANGDWSGVWNSVSSTVGGAWNEVTKKTASLASTVTAVFKDAKPDFKTFTENVTKGLSGLPKTIKGFFGGIGDFLFGSSDKEKAQAPVPEVDTKALETSLGRVSGAVSEAFSSAINPITSIQNAISGLGSFVSGTFLGNWASSFGKLPADMKPERVSSVTSTLKNTFSGLTGFLSGTFLGDWAKNFGKLPADMKPEECQKVIESMKTSFGGMTSFVTDIFTGNWKKAWEGVTKAFSDVWSTLGALIKAPINAVIALINRSIKKINESLNIDFSGWPKWMQPEGGKIGISIPEIPMLASGGIATAPTLAGIGEGSEPEAILPLSRLSSMLNPAPQPALAPVTVNISVNVQGASQGSTAQDVTRAVEKAGESLKAQLERLLANQRRLAY